MKLEYSNSGFGVRVRDGDVTVAFVHDRVFHGKLRTLREVREIMASHGRGEGPHIRDHARAKTHVEPVVDDWADHGEI